MNCKEALTWFRGVIVPFLLSHQPRILYGAQVLLLTIICFTAESALPAYNIDLEGGCISLPGRIESSWCSHSFLPEGKNVPVYSCSVVD